MDKKTEHGAKLIMQLYNYSSAYAFKAGPGNSFPASNHVYILNVILVCVCFSSYNATKSFQVIYSPGTSQLWLSDISFDPHFCLLLIFENILSLHILDHRHFSGQCLSQTGTLVFLGNLPLSLYNPPYYPVLTPASGKLAQSHDTHILPINADGTKKTW